jgi:hypothetical protein
MTGFALAVVYASLLVVAMGAILWIMKRAKR